MKRCLVLVLLLPLLLNALVMPLVVKAEDPTITITVIGYDGEPLANAKVTVYDEAGNTYEGTTDENGTATITVPANASYLIVVKSEYYILDTVTVSGDTNVTIDASKMYYAVLKSTPKSVDVKVVLLAFKDVSLTLSTNVTVYAPSSINVTYPKEIVEVPYKYVLEKIEYDGKETNQTTVTLDMTETYVVTGTYVKTFYLTLEYWLVILLVAVLVVALIVAGFAAGARTATAMVVEWKEKNRKYVRRK